MKILFKLFIALVLLLVVGSFFIPNTYEIQRTVHIKKPAIMVFLHVGGLENWPAWNPWQQRDPGYKVTLGEKTSGVGASQTWESKHGGGELTFTWTNPGKGVEFDYRYRGDWETKSAFRLQQQQDGTMVTWILKGKIDKPVIGSYMAAFQDEMTGGMLSYGLKLLKQTVEADDREVVN